MEQSEQAANNLIRVFCTSSNLWGTSQQKYDRLILTNTWQIILEILQNPPAKFIFFN